MELWLMRHGKASPPSDQTLDADRKLVEQGISDVQKMAEELERLLQGRSFQLWSSPLARARETTSIVANQLQGVPHIQEEIAEGRLLPLLAIWEKNKADIHIVVGHEPSLSHWLGTFVELDQEFSTASVAMIQVENWSPPLGRLKSYLRPQDLEKR